MRCQLWPEESAATHRREIKSFFAGGSLDPAAVLIAEDGERVAQGFAEVTVRSHAEGCSPGRIAYLEGWYVERASRRKGVGRALMQAAENWARANHCHEFASDAWSTNRLSRTAHLALGFEEVGVVRCFRKTLTKGASASREPTRRRGESGAEQRDSRSRKRLSDGSRRSR